ncbi:concanavalin A-like lectin/glucanase, partial [Microstroma glucosiphilum]
MTRSSSPTFVITLISLVVLLLFVNSLPLANAADSCSASSPCSSSSSPCCSHSGFCGSGTLFCGGGCSPLASKTATDCMPMPVCIDRNVTLTPSDYNDTSLFVPVLQYAGNASQGLFTLDAGSLAAGPEGVMMQMTENSLVKLSTTAYILYGEMEVTCRHTAYQGVVATMITMSDVLDEIDWEFTTSNSSDAQTNWFPQGRIVSGSGKDSQPTSGTLDVSEWVTYGINWQPDRLQWLINGAVVRTLKRTDYSYPSTPTRLQLSVWAGGNSTNAQGVIDWSGGPISYTNSQYTTNGYYGMEISSVSIKCADTSIANVSTIGKGSNGPTSWTYTG